MKNKVFFMTTIIAGLGLLILGVVFIAAGLLGVAIVAICQLLTQ